MVGLSLIGDVNATTSSIASGTVASQSPSAHASTVAGDIVVIPIASKPSGSAISTPGGWTALTARVVGSGTSSESAGLQRGSFFWQTLSGSYSAPTLTVNGTGAVLASGVITFRPDAGWTVEITDSSGSDTSSDTSISITGDTVLPFVDGDFLITLLLVPNSAVSQASLDAVSGTTPGGMSGATLDTYNSRWNTGGNGGAAGFSQRTLCVSADCTAGLATTAPSITASPDVATTAGVVFYRIHPVHYPWHILGIDGTAAGNHFKLQAARDGAGVTYEKTRAEIVAGYYEDPYFIAAGTDQEWCRFQVRMDSATTSGTTFPRSELREMQTNGTSEAAWNTASGTHRMRAKMRIPHLPAVKPTVVFAQIHDGTDDVIQLTTELNDTTGLVEVKCRVNGTSAGQPKLKLDYQEGDEHEYMIEVIAGTTKIYWDDLYSPVITTTAVATSTAYFKTGAYPNTNETIDSPTEFAQVDIRDLIVWHTGYTGPDGVPPPGLSPPLRQRSRFRHLLVR